MVDKNSVRIIGGKYKSRKINILPNSNIRPTSDRIRETVFNWLMHNIVNSRVLDLFAGSGAMTLEALSRHAEFVLCNDANPKIINHLDKTIKNIDPHLNSDKVKLSNSDAIKLLQQSPEELNLAPFDIIILDPPFNKNYLTVCFDLLLKNNWVKTNSLIYFEAESRLNLSNILTDSFNLIKFKITGNVYCGLLSLKN